MRNWPLVVFRLLFAPHEHMKAGCSKDKRIILGDIITREMALRDQNREGGACPCHPGYSRPNQVNPVRGICVRRYLSKTSRLHSATCRGRRRRPRSDAVPKSTPAAQRTRVSRDRGGSGCEWMRRARGPFLTQPRRDSDFAGLSEVLARLGLDCCRNCLPQRDRVQSELCPCASHAGDRPLALAPQRPALPRGPAPSPPPPPPPHRPLPFSRL